MAEDYATTVYGRAFKVPFEVDGRGALAITEGDDLIWQQVESVLETPLYSLEADPELGCILAAYEQPGQVDVWALRTGQAIADAVPAIATLTVEVVDIDAAQGTVYLRVEITTQSDASARSRVFPYYATA